jgi:hypothetical protein
MKTRKTLIRLFSLAMAMSITGFVQAQITPSYTIVDLNSGQSIYVYYDDATWRTVNKATNEPVEYYIVRYNDPVYPADTVHGITGLIVNNLIWKNDEGKWKFNDAKVKWDGDELKMKDKYGRKVKWEKGALKIKDWNSKYKSGKDDEAKYKQEWDKIKWKEDEVKIEQGASKTKVRQ